MIGISVVMALSLLACAVAPAGGDDFNARILAAVRAMPRGGGYDGSDATKNLLPKACAVENGRLVIDARQAQPSFCSSATYLVLLQALEGVVPPEALSSLLPVPDQADGEGVFGRWNANGPGCAKLVADLDAGDNFTDWEAARPGDMLKIWWTEAIGNRERGHHVVYLGHDDEVVRFWSSNQPGGYGEKEVPRSKCKRVLFTRVNRPENFAKASGLPPRDEWLAGMLVREFSWSEVARVCRVR
ncbi:MAG: hypothetical protein Q7Q71_13310 [Verrucomicrobiota bacterium JB023]|nr:hypothetical protein [Verrucomicrobiota bacterium JB023]